MAIRCACYVDFILKIVQLSLLSHIGCNMCNADLLINNMYDYFDHQQLQFMAVFSSRDCI